MKILFIDDIPKQRTKKQIKEQEKAIKKLWNVYKKRKDDNTKFSIFGVNMNCEGIDGTITQSELGKGDKKLQYYYCTTCDTQTNCSRVEMPLSIYLPSDFKQQVDKEIKGE